GGAAAGELTLVEVVVPPVQVEHDEARRDHRERLGVVLRPVPHDGRDDGAVLVGEQLDRLRGETVAEHVRAPAAHRRRLVLAQRGVRVEGGGGLGTCPWVRGRRRRRRGGVVVGRLLTLC